MNKACVQAPSRSVSSFSDMLALRIRRWYSHVQIQKWREAFIPKRVTRGFLLLRLSIVCSLINASFYYWMVKHCYVFSRCYSGGTLFRHIDEWRFNINTDIVETSPLIQTTQAEKCVSCLSHMQWRHDWEVVLFVRISAGMNLYLSFTNTQKYQWNCSTETELTKLDILIPFCLMLMCCKLYISYRLNKTFSCKPLTYKMLRPCMKYEFINNLKPLHNIFFLKTVNISRNTMKPEMYIPLCRRHHLPIVTWHGTLM
jgi:hypothetical protein